MKESTEPKIDLAEIEGHCFLLKNKIQLAKERGDCELKITDRSAKQIAAALEALPKLVEALQNLHAAYAWSKGDETPQQTTALDNAYLALKNLGLAPFTTKTPQQ